MRNMTEAIDEARQLGAEYGRVAAQAWLADSSERGFTRRMILNNLENGAWNELHVPVPDLSGEWADGWTPAVLGYECGVDLDSDDWANWQETELCDAYEAAFDSAVRDEIVRVCRHQLETSEA